MKVYTQVKKITVLLFITLIIILLPKISYALEFTTIPKRIIIPAIKLDLPITESQITNETWEVSYREATFGVTSAIPGNKGNTVIFAHAMPHLFINLTNVKKGDIVNLFTDIDWFEYKVTETKIVNPEDIYVLHPNNAYEITLYTCTGENWSKRFVVKAQLTTSPISP